MTALLHLHLHLYPLSGVFLFCFFNIGRFPTRSHAHPSPEACVLGPARGESEASWYGMGLAGAAAVRRYSLLGRGCMAV